MEQSLANGVLEQGPQVIGLEAFLQIHPAAGWLIHLVPGDFDIRPAMGRMGEPAMWILGSNFWVWRPCASGVQSQCSSRRPRHLAAQEVSRARWPCSPSNHSTSCTARAACPKVAHGRARGSEEAGPRNLQLGHQICLWINTAKFKSIYSKYYFKRDEHNFASYLDVHTGLDSQPFWIQDWVVKKSSGKGQGQAQQVVELGISNTYPQQVVTSPRWRATGSVQERKAG